MKKKSFLKKALTPILMPAARSYLKKERTTRFLGIVLKIPIGIFHPSFFFSTKTMGKFLLTQKIIGKKILEIGCGSGAISIIASKAGAKVYCCDINPLAVSTTIQNSIKNHVQLNAQISDLFESIEERNFDLIINNPPYYPRNPSNMEENAWYAGENFEYFQRLFKNAKNYLIPKGTILLVLSDQCNIELINRIATRENFRPQTTYTRSTFMEKTYIIEYRIQE